MMNSTRRWRGVWRYAPRRNHGSFISGPICRGTGGRLGLRSFIIIAYCTYVFKCWEFYQMRARPARMVLERGAMGGWCAIRGRWLGREANFVQERLAVCRRDARVGGHREDGPDQRAVAGAGVYQVQ